MFENGSVLYRADGFRGGVTGFYLKPFGSMMVDTRYFLPGQTATISHKHAQWFPVQFLNTNNSNWKHGNATPATT